MVGTPQLEDEVIIYAKEMIVELESELKQKERKDANNDSGADTRSA